MTAQTAPGRRRTRPAPLTTGVRPSRGSIALTTVLMVLFLLYSVAPVWWLLVSSTKGLSDLYGSFGLWFSGDFHLGANVRDTLTYHDHIYLRWIGNSILYAGVGAAGATLISLAAGYGMAKYRFRGRAALFATTIAASLLPTTLIALPLYLVFAKIGLTGTVWSVLIPSFINPYCVYLGRVYAESTVPDELIEAARMDGAGELRIFATIALKLMTTGAITIFMLDFITIWNNFFLPLFMLSGEKTFPVTLGLYSWNQEVVRAQNMTPMVVTGSLLSIVPLALFMISLQRFWRGGILAGSLR
ncbi:carbohydrate ABC transporter permease [Actinoallomurus acanthiterrae]